jgi:hypothetical protein
MSALGSACGRRGPSPIVLGRPARRTTSTLLRQHTAAARASRANGLAPWSVVRLVIPDIRS